MRTLTCAGSLDLWVVEGTPMMAAPMRAAAATMARRAVLIVTARLLGPVGRQSLQDTWWRLGPETQLPCRH